MVLHKLKNKSGPKSEVLISLAVFELQKGQACPAREIINIKNSSRTFILNI